MPRRGVQFPNIVYSRQQPATLPTIFTPIGRRDTCPLDGQWKIQILALKNPPLNMDCLKFPLLTFSFSCAGEKSRGQKNDGTEESTHHWTLESRRPPRDLKHWGKDRLICYTFYRIEVSVRRRSRGEADFLNGEKFLNLCICQFCQPWLRNPGWLR